MPRIRIQRSGPRLDADGFPLVRAAIRQPSLFESTDPLNSECRASLIYPEFCAPRIAAEIDLQD